MSARYGNAYMGADRYNEWSCGHIFYSYPIFSFAKVQTIRSLLIFFVRWSFRRAKRWKFAQVCLKTTPIIRVHKPFWNCLRGPKDLECKYWYWFGVCRVETRFLSIFINLPCAVRFANSSIIVLCAVIWSLCKTRIATVISFIIIIIFFFF